MVTSLPNPSHRAPSRLARRQVLAAAVLAAASGPALAATRQSPIVELRQYTCHEGRRDELISLFEREFIETQNAVGAQVLGTFRDRDDPDRFVWLRGFEDMPARAKALTAFYSGPTWRAHRGAANPTMLDAANVLLLHPVEPGGGFPPQPAAAPSGEILAFIHYLDDALLLPFARFFEAHMRPKAEADGARVLATFASETSPNTFPALPVREADRVFVWFVRARPGFLDARRRWSGWRDAADEALLPALMRKPEVLRLEPTARSPLR